MIKQHDKAIGRLGDALDKAGKLTKPLQQSQAKSEFIESDILPLLLLRHMEEATSNNHQAINAIEITPVKEGGASTVFRRQRHKLNWTVDYTNPAKNDKV